MLVLIFVGTLIAALRISWKHLKELFGHFEWIQLQSYNLELTKKPRLFINYIFIYYNYALCTVANTQSEIIIIINWKSQGKLLLYLQSHPCQFTAANYVFVIRLVSY